MDFNTVMIYGHRYYRLMSIYLYSQGCLITNHALRVLTGTREPRMIAHLRTRRQSRYIELARW